MSSILNHIPGLRGPSPAFDRLPGSDGLDELYHLHKNGRAFFHDRFEQYGRVFKSRLVYPVVFVVGEEANRTVHLTRRADFSMGRGYSQTAVDKVFEDSIMVQDGEAHARTRSILAPAVGRLEIRQQAEAVYEIWSRAVQRGVSQKSVDCYELVQATTYEVALAALVGITDRERLADYKPHFEHLMEGILAPTKIRFPRGKLDKALNAREYLIAGLDAPIAEARRKPPTGLLGLLAHHRDPDGTMLTNREIAQHLLLLGWAGYDTTASAGSWVLHVLAERPDWQERLRSELAAAGDDVAMLEGDPRFEVADWFLYEIERMYPSALFFPRIALADVSIYGHTIPQESVVFYTPYMSGRDPASFEHPNAFDPERWSKARGERRASPAKLFGFGGGPRVCLGKAFAKMQLKLMMHALLRDHRVEPDPTSRSSVMCIPVHHPVGSKVRILPLGAESPVTNDRRARRGVRGDEA